MKEWKELFELEEKKEYYQKLMQFLDEEYKTKIIYPPREDLFTCFEACPYQDVKVVILGQDPYHRPQQAHGLCFSVRKGVKIPPSLKNMYKELKSDLDIDMPSHGYLIDWAKQGVLLLNATLTVRAHQAASHQRKGWEEFTDAAIKALSKDKEHLVFILWGCYARSKAKLIDTSKHLILESVHPSPLSANRGGWFGNHHFSRCNAYLQQNGITPIQW